MKDSEYFAKFIIQDTPVFGTTYQATFEGLLPVTTYTVNAYPVNDEDEIGDVATIEATTGTETVSKYST